MEFEYLEQYKYLSNACLNITDACNLACKYCFVNQNPHYMTLETAKSAVDFLVSNLRIKKENKWASPEDTCGITFFGGEPTLLWDEIIIPLVAYTKEKYPNECYFTITTNGTLLTKERIDFLYDNEIPLLLSIDGYKDTQDYNRPCHNGESSFDKIIDNIPYILEKFPNTTFRSTIYQDTVDKLFENYIFASYMGFKNMFFVPDTRGKWEYKIINELSNQLSKIFQYIENTFNNGYIPILCSPIEKMYELILRQDIKIINKDFTPIDFNVERCGLGTMSGSIGYDGSIYGCQEQDSNVKNIFYLGNIFNNGIEQNKHIKLLTEYIKNNNICSNEKLCDYCKIKHMCLRQNCPSATYELYNTFYISNEMDCIWNNLLFDNCINLMNIMVNNNNLLFKQYLNEYCNFKQYLEE